MDRSLKFIMNVFVFFVFLCLLSDITILRITKERIKDALDVSTKAAALQANEDENKISEGIFEIDNDKARSTFLEMMSLNLNKDIKIIDDCMIDYRALNSPTVYINPATGKEYYIEKPTFIAAMKFQFNGILIKKDIIITNNFAGSVLLGKQ